MAKSSYDLLVIGGGPAGSAAAITARIAGMNVLVLERSRFPRDRPGETLHPGIEPLLRQLGVWDEVSASGYVRHSGIWLSDIQAGPRRFEPYGSDASGAWHGLQVPRREIDRHLLDRARQLGAEIRCDVAVDDVIIDQAQVVGVTTTQGPIYAPVTIDASGGSHRLAHKLGIEVKEYSQPLVARYGYATGSHPSLDDAPEFRIEPGGWLWQARVGEGRYHWTRLALEANSETLGPPNDFQGLTPEGMQRAENVTWRCAERLAGRGFFLTGDAAAVLDPASSRGVLKAIMTGTQAATLAGAIKNGQIPSDDATTWYDQWLRGWFHQDLHVLLELYASAGLSR